MKNSDNSNDSPDIPWLSKLTQAFSNKPKTLSDIIKLIKSANNDELIDQDAMGIIEGALKVSNMQVREIMIPRSQMESIEFTNNFREVLSCVVKSAHSRYPVIGESNDEVVGILLAKDLLSLALKENPELTDIGALIRPPTFVPESKRLNVLLKEFRENRNHMAIVIDEYGGAAGLVTIEDVLEQIVGEIEDEHDVDPDSHIKKLASNDFIINALTPIDEFNQHFNAQLHNNEFDTVGGLIVHSFGHLPRKNETATIEGYEFKILNADKRRVHLLRMKIVNTADAS